LHSIRTGEIEAGTETGCELLLNIKKEVESHRNKTKKKEAIQIPVGGERKVTKG